MTLLLKEYVPAGKNIIDPATFFRKSQGLLEPTRNKE